MEHSIKPYSKPQIHETQKIIVFADHLVLMVQVESIGEAENFANIELDKIAEWATDNKIKFNEEKSKLMLLTIRKRKEQKKVAVYLNNKTTPQVKKLNIWE